MLLANVTFDTWYYCYGHPSTKHMIALKNALHFETKTFSSSSPCPVCPLAKQKKLSFVSNNHVTSHSFELIHCDI